MLKTLFGLSLAGSASLLAALQTLRQGEAPERFGEEIELGEGRAYLSLPLDEEPIGALGDSGVVDAEAHDFIPFCRGLG